MSYNDNGVDNKVLGIFGGARAYAWGTGTIKMLITWAFPEIRPTRRQLWWFATSDLPGGAIQKAGSRSLGRRHRSGMDKLPEEWREKFRAASQPALRAIRAADAGTALRELAPEYMIRLAEDFRKEIIQ